MLIIRTRTSPYRRSVAVSRLEDLSSHHRHRVTHVGRAADVGDLAYRLLQVGARVVLVEQELEVGVVAVHHRADARPALAHVQAVDGALHEVEHRLPVVLVLVLNAARRVDRERQVGRSVPAIWYE